MVKFKLTGAVPMIGRIAKAQTRLAQGSARALAAEATAVFKASQLLVPELTGELKSSGNVSQVATGSSLVNGAPSLSVTITYGPLPHTLAVHEHPSKHSPPSWAGGVTFRNGRGPKFLERPLFDRAQNMDSTIAKAIQL